MSLNLADEELVSAEESTIDPQPNLAKTGSTLFPNFFSIHEEEVASVKDSVTSGLPTQGPIESCDNSGIVTSAHMYQ